MKVFDLQCRAGDRFEGWFASEDDYRSQEQRGLVSCPVCGSTEITRMPSAPRLNLGQAGASEPASAKKAPEQGGAHGGEAASIPQQMQASYLQAVRHLMANSEDMGPRFAEEARRIHYGEAEQRPIRGQADAQERAALQEEGIEVVRLPIPQGMDGPLQ